MEFHLLMKLYFTLFIAVCFGLQLQARIMTAWNYDMLNDKATLVVIARAVAVTNTSERAALPNIHYGTNDIIAAGVETRFKVLTVLKGDRNLQTLVLHHYAPIPSERLVMGGPELINFEPKERKTFLLFLVLEPDGRYAAASGQTDPFCSVSEFEGRVPNELDTDIDPKNSSTF